VEQSNNASLLYLLEEDPLPPKPFRSRLPFPNRKATVAGARSFFGALVPSAANALAGGRLPAAARVRGAAAPGEALRRERRGDAGLPRRHEPVVGGGGAGQEGVRGGGGSRGEDRGGGERRNGRVRSRERHVAGGERVGRGAGEVRGCGGGGEGVRDGGVVVAVHVPAEGVGVRGGEGHVAGDGHRNEGGVERGGRGGGRKSFHDRGVRRLAGEGVRRRTRHVARGGRWEIPEGSYEAAVLRHGVGRPNLRGVSWFERGNWKC